MEFYDVVGQVLIVHKGYAHADVERIYTRAQTLYQQVGETPQIFPVLRGLWDFSFLRGNLQIAQALAEQ
jgi:hypothetical protein